jgi:hypothetical protein
VSGSHDLARRAEAPKVPTALTITTASDGTHSGTWASPRGSTPIGEIAIEGDTIRISVPAVMGSWEGKLTADGSTLEGEWRQGGTTSPLVLARVAAQ